LSDGPLAGIRIVDLTDERAIYGAKLLADLGADVVRPEPPGGDPLRQRGPHAASGDSLWHAFFATSRRFVTIDPDSDADVAQLRRLAERADIVLTCDGAFGTGLLDFDALRAAHPSQVVVAVSSFGDDGPWRDMLAPDLVAGALGGIVATTGTPDTTPLKTFGEMNFMTSGSYTAIAALSALRHARVTGEGQRVGVPVHECIAATLEHVLMFALYGERMGRGRLLPRQGGINWTMAYMVLPAKTGAIMVTPAPNFDNQVVWFVEEGIEEDLLDPKYQEPENAMLYVNRIMEILAKWVAQKDPEQLFFEGQERHAPYGWVLPIERLRENPQLEARNWWVPYRIGGADVRGPGTPYRLSDTPWARRDPVTTDAATVLADLGWSQPAAGGAR
jgi:crotonobetainyl-CoA:carnitine CoA-transferase CaiB-like acyl-CoA transferase